VEGFTLAVAQAVGRQEPGCAARFISSASQIFDSGRTHEGPARSRSGGPFVR
jgi:hypothetical protein